jgi:adenylate cyclase
MAYRFGEYLLEPREHRLCRGSREIPLRPKTFETLLYLVDHHDRVVTKDELLGKVWADAYVVETVVAHSVSELRRVLEEDVQLPHFIRTVPKVGYKFIAPVAATDTGTDPARAAPGRASSIAVLPFRDMSADGSLDYFCEGLAEEIINALTQMKQLRVAARTSSFAFKNRDCDLREIGDTLGVETVLEGSLRGSSERLRVGAQLVEAANGFHLWSEQFDFAMGDVLSLQDQISRKIIEYLKVGILEGERSASRRRKTESVDAYLLNLRGRHLMLREAHADLSKAIEYFERSIEADPNYAQPHAGRSLCYSSLGFWNGLPPPQAYEEAKKSAIRAVEIDPESALAHGTLGFVALVGDWDWELADRASKRSVELNPRSDLAWLFRVTYHLAVGQTEEAIAGGVRAVEVEPLSNFSNSYLALALLRGGGLERAVEQLEGTIELEPFDSRTRFFLGQAYVLAARHPEGIAEILRALDQSARNILVLSGLGWAYGMAGRRSEALGVVEELKRRFIAEYPRPYSVAKIYAGLGEKDLAFEWLDRAFLERDTSLALSRTDESLGDLRGDSRFADLMRRMRLEP